MCLRPNLARPANTLYRHNLTATLESAIRSSSAQHDSSDVLRRLDARMLEYSHGEIGWDVFILEYKVDSPIDTVLDSESIEKYLKLFRHLWQLKRVELTLNKGWMRVTSGVRSFLKVPGGLSCLPMSDCSNLTTRSESRLASVTACNSRNGSFRPSDACVLPA